MLSQIVFAIIGSGAFTTLVSAYVNRHFAKKDRKEDELKVMRESLEVLVHDSYHRFARQLIIKDVLTEDELDNHNYLYKAYKALGLNDTGEALHQQIMKKEVRYNG